MATTSHKILHSSHPGLRLLKSALRAIRNFSLPAPRVLIVPMLWTFLAIRWAYYFFLRVFICEPLFKAYCKQVGKGVRTDVYIPWVTGQGDLIVGDGVLIDGRVGFKFAARFSECPRLEIGARTHIGHQCNIIVGKSVSIGTDCLIASGTLIFDSSGHPTDPESRLAGLPPTHDAVQPICIGNNVWIGKNSMIFPGVTIGDGSVIAAGSIVMRDVAPNTLAAGNPARASLALGAASAPKDDTTRNRS